MKIIDMHCDTIAEIWYSQKDVAAGKAAVCKNLRENDLQLDLMKMKKGDYLLQNFAMFVNLERKENPLESVMHLVDVFYTEMEKNKDLIGVVKNYADIEANIQAGKMSAMLTVEEGGVCKGEIPFLRDLYRLGVRMMTLTWNHENSLAYPNNVPGDGEKVFPYEPDMSRGLKEKGFAFIEEMERLGIIIDVSHLSDAGFYDVYGHTSKPFVASHSNARALCGHCRNLTDDMIRKLAERGGVTGLNYCCSFLMEPDENGHVQSRVAKLAEHAKYLAKVGGIDCIGLGSDFDGIGGDLEMKDASMLPLLADALQKAGFHESEVDKILYKNVLRVYKEVLL